MTCTPQTNASLSEIAAELLLFDRIAICGHKNPDGDSVGSNLGLANALRNLGKTVYSLLACADEPDTDLGFLPGSDTFRHAETFDEPIDAFVVVDAPNADRIKDGWRVFQTAKRTFLVDHHANDERIADLSHTDPDAASASLLVWEIVKMLNPGNLKECAQCCLTGLITDTGRFQYQNSDCRAFMAASEMVQAGASVPEICTELFQNRNFASIKLESRMFDRVQLGAQGAYALSWIGEADIAECDAKPEDSEPLSALLRTIRGVRVSCFLKERDGDIRGSLRAKDDTDVSALARKYDGGGHKAAAGFTLHCTMPEALSLMASELAALVADQNVKDSVNG